MKFSHVLLIGVLVTTQTVRAVYAPIPEIEQGRDFVASVRGGLSYDSNIFGGASDAIGSAVWQVAPRISYNHSLTDQTFVSAIYGLTLDDIERRPGSHLLDSHDLTLRLAHAFSQNTTLDLNNVFMVARNPESLLNGVALNTDQSFVRDQFDGRWQTALSPKVGLELKTRSAWTKYRNAALGRSLDRIENLYGMAGSYAVLPEVKAVAEYRHQDVYYRKSGETKNKNSEYAMVGADYDVARKVTLVSRAGAEWRRRASEQNATNPYAELSGRYQYAERSFVTGGYSYSFDESSDTARFTDQKVNRLFVNVQHSLTALVIASASADYEPSVQQARRGLGIGNQEETTARFGGALTYTPTKNWSLSATYDFDHTQSDDPARSVERHRAGLSAAYTF